MRLYLATLLAASVCISAIDALADNGDLSVQTKGGVVHGTIDSATPAVRQFLGIPYARPPVENLRFAPPQPALPFGELEAKQMPPSCMQYMSLLPNIYTREVPEFNLGGFNETTGPISEDCLFLSVWAPRLKSKKKLPVIIFFYGGAFTVGGINAPYLVPSNWIQRTQNHIVVAFNHRDNIVGYPNAAGLPPDKQNVGLLDARLAVEWVRDNIGAFGGDPERIGLWGQSSGGIIISYYSYVYREDPIANSVILASGNEFIDILSHDPTHGNFTFVASHFGCGNLNPADELACMRRADVGQIEDFLRAHGDVGRTPPAFFSAVIDEHTVFADYASLARAGRIARLPALIGSNAQEGITFIPYDPNGGDLALADQMTMTFFFCPTYQAARARIAAHGGDVPVYRYLYAGNFSNVSPKGWMGAYHGAEEPMVFETHSLVRGESTALQRKTAHAMQDAWVSFVATAGRRMTVEGWGAKGEEGLVDGGRVVEFGNGVPARLVDTSELEKQCREMGISLVNGSD
ncbi:Alpha/Beta hydrolase protein [Corynascus novoguineensis]|uniref:Carboxylic ester hydrolase n=1 Tax=Corynascus novoguineensis TaxID=1126955 RepID=A0AAN7HP09_9PEZI|nr:Alpha/Beta hydrolase protein [Corynascus novoguineensis]